MSPVAVPADKRFRRALVKPSRKRRHWRATALPALRYVLIAVALAYGVYRGSAVAAQARVLRVDRIVVRGNERLSNGEVLAVLNGLRGESLIWTDLGAWRRRLLSSPWVRDAAFKRALPSTVEVVVSERQAVGIARIEGELYLVDERGVIIDQYGPQYADLDLPIIDGLNRSASVDGVMTDEPRAELAWRVIAAVRSKPELARRLSQIDVTDLHNATVILSGDTAALQLGDDQFLRRLQSYVEVSAVLRERVPTIDSVDLRFDNRIYVRPAAQAAAGRPATGRQPVAKRQR